MFITQKQGFGSSATYLDICSPTGEDLMLVEAIKGVVTRVIGGFSCTSSHRVGTNICLLMDAFHDHNKRLQQLDRLPGCLSAL
jgi:hypothetical protein